MYRRIRSEKKPPAIIDPRGVRRKIKEFVSTPLEKGQTLTLPYGVITLPSGRKAILFGESGESHVDMVKRVKEAQPVQKGQPIRFEHFGSLSRHGNVDPYITHVSSPLGIAPSSSTAVPERIMDRVEKFFRQRKLNVFFARREKPF